MPKEEHSWGNPFQFSFIFMKLCLGSLSLTLSGLACQPEHPDPVLCSCTSLATPIVVFNGIIQNSQSQQGRKREKLQKLENCKGHQEEDVCGSLKADPNCHCRNYLSRARSWRAPSSLSTVTWCISQIQNYFSVFLFSQAFCLQMIIALWIRLPESLLVGWVLPFQLLEILHPLQIISVVCHRVQ